MFFRKPIVQKVMIELVDVRPYRQVVQLRDTPVTSLPESLEPGTPAQFGNIAFEIVEAVPSTREEIADTHHVRLVVRYQGSEGEEDVEASHVHNTVCGLLPPFEPGSAKMERLSYQLGEADWRQVEFVSRKLAFEIEQSLAGIQDILTNHEVDGGYDAHYSRDLIPQPFGSLRIPFDDITTLFAEGREDRDGVSILGHANVVAGGFAFRTASITDIYGYKSDGMVRALCFGGIGTYEYDSPEVQAIADFCLENDLCLIDWQAAMKFDPETEDFFAYFDPPDNLDEVYQEAPL